MYILEHRIVLALLKGLFKLMVVRDEIGIIAETALMAEKGSIRLFYWLKKNVFDRVKWIKPTDILKGNRHWLEGKKADSQSAYRRKRKFSSITEEEWDTAVGYHPSYLICMVNGW